MVQLTCDTCGSNALVRTGVGFVCKHCGTQYTEKATIEVMQLLLDKLYKSEKAEAEALAEATQLDCQIKLLEEYKPYYDEFCQINPDFKNLNKGSSLFPACLMGCGSGLLTWITVAFIVNHTIGIHWSDFLQGLVKFIIFASIIIAGVITYKKEENERAEAQSRLEIVVQNYNMKYAEIKEKVHLIPERFWGNGDVVRDYYQNWGAKNRKDLLAHLEEHYRKPDVIRETVPVYIPKKG